MEAVANGAAVDIEAEAPEEVKEEVIAAADAAREVMETGSIESEAHGQEGEMEKRALKTRALA